MGDSLMVVVKCPCCGKSLEVSLSVSAVVSEPAVSVRVEPVGSGSWFGNIVDDVVDVGIVWRCGTTRSGKECVYAFQKDNLDVGGDVKGVYAVLYNKIVTDAPFVNGYFYWKDDDVGVIGRVKCRNKFKGGS